MNTSQQYQNLGSHCDQFKSLRCEHWERSAKTVARAVRSTLTCDGGASGPLERMIACGTTFAFFRYGTGYEHRPPLRARARGVVCKYHARQAGILYQICPFLTRNSLSGDESLSFTSWWRSTAHCNGIVKRIAFSCRVIKNYLSGVNS